MPLVTIRIPVRGTLLGALICLTSLKGLQAQSNRTDTLRLSLQEIEKKFIDSNLLLLAAHYNVDAQKALILQAKVWDNPVLNTDQVIAADGIFFPYGHFPDGSYSGQYYLQVQQLIRTAGKRGKLINLASTNAKLSELQLQDLLRNLRYQLRTDYFTILYQLDTKSIYEQQWMQLQILLKGMDAQLGAGNIAQKDYLRIQGLLVALEQDMLELKKNIADTQADLKTLLQLRDAVFIAPVQPFNESIKLVNQTILFDSAKINNPNYQLQKTMTIYQQQNLSYQKALKTPDITLGPNFDRNSSFAPNYVGLGISIPIPISNTNKGNIKSAEYSVKQQETIVSNAETELWNNINNAYSKLLLQVKQSNAVRQDFYQQYENMYRNVTESYQSRKIGLLEFLDFFNDYTDSRQRFLQQQLNLRLIKEELNYHTGIDLLK